MVIEVRLHDALKRFVPSSTSGIVVADVPDDFTVRELVKELEINFSEVKRITINGMRNETQQTLVDGDRVDLFSS